MEEFVPRPVALLLLLSHGRVFRFPEFLHHRVSGTRSERSSNCILEVLAFAARERVAVSTYDAVFLRIYCILMRFYEELGNFIHVIVEIEVGLKRRLLDNERLCLINNNKMKL